MAKKKSKRIPTRSVVNLSITRLAGTNDWRAAWGFPYKNCSGFDITWTYTNYAGQSKNSDPTSVTVGEATASLSDTTLRNLGIRVVPRCSVKKGKKGYWNSGAAYASIVLPEDFYTGTPSNPSAPSVSIDENNRVVVSLEYADSSATVIKVQVCNQNHDQIRWLEFGTNEKNVYKWSDNASPGVGYCARALSANRAHTSTWSGYSQVVYAKPSRPSRFTSVSAQKDGVSVKLTWDKCPGASGYTIEYTTEQSYFDHTSAVQSQSVGDTNMAIVSGLEQGKTWWFRLKATNSTGDSGWSEQSSIKIGTKPSPPTTYSDTTVCYIGDKVLFSWVHNSEDTSKQTKAQISVIINGQNEKQFTVTGDDSAGNPITEYQYDTKDCQDGDKVQWKVRTWGLIDTPSDWSLTRQVQVWAPVTVVLENFPEIVRSYPLTFNIAPKSGVSQWPIGYSVQVTTINGYTTTNKYGEPEKIDAGEKIFEKYYDVTDNPLKLSLKPNDIDLESTSVQLTEEATGSESYSKAYHLKVTVAMSSGLSAQTELDFPVIFDSSAELYPYAYFQVAEDGYSVKILPVCSTVDTDAAVTEDEYVEENDATEGPMAPSTDPNEAIGAPISVYRKEDNGTEYVAIVEDYPDDGVTIFVDPHPYMRSSEYRIVAVDTKTGTMSYRDVLFDGIESKDRCILIQWDEDASVKKFQTNQDTNDTENPTGGYALRLPYNVDISDTTSPDVSAVKYIGRRYPVSYYGTQIGESGTWSSVIPADDTDTLKLIRRLSMWMGDCYVREPSGLGFWANVKVSYNKNHNEVTIPVTLTITRVEGDV